MSSARQQVPLPTDLPGEPGHEIDLGTLWQGVRQRLPVTVLVAALIAGGVYTGLRLQPDVYEAAAALLASSSQSQIGVVGGSVTSPLPPATVTEVVHSPLILRPLIQALGKDLSIVPAERQRLTRQLTRELLIPLPEGSGSQRKRTIAITANQGSGENSVYQIRARAQSPQAARVLANQTARLLIDWDAERTLRDIGLARGNFTLQLAQTDRRLSLPGLSSVERQTLLYRRATMQDNLAQLSFLEQLRPGVLRLLTDAAEPVKPVSPSPLSSAALIGVLALLLGTGVAALLTALDRRVRSEADLLALGLPVLETLPRLRGTGGLRQTEALEFLRINLRALLPEPHAVAMISGPLGGEGSSTLTAALARSLAVSGERVLILDAASRPGGQQALWGVDPGEQAWHALTGTGGARTLPEALRDPGNVQVRQVAPGVDLLPAGPLAQGGFGQLAHADLGASLRLWSRGYDLVLVDSPPLLVQADGLTLGQRVDGVLVVAEAGRTLLPDLRRVLGRMQLAGVPVLGFALNKAGRTLPVPRSSAPPALPASAERGPTLEEVR